MLLGIRTREECLVQATVLTIDVDDPLRSDVLALLEQHLADMLATSPPESVHALDPAALTDPAVTFWTARDGDGALLGTVALATLDGGAAELKSMRTVPAARGRGVGAALLDHALAEATRRGLARVLLETGTQDYFAAARRLYRRAGFVECPPFAGYVLDPHSVFLRRDLRSTDLPAATP